MTLWCSILVFVFGAQSHICMPCLLQSAYLLMLSETGGVCVCVCVCDAQDISIMLKLCGCVCVCVRARTVLLTRVDGY